MNEALLLLHLLLLGGFTWGAVRLGKAALLTLVSVEALLANLFVLKQVSFFGAVGTATDLFAVSSIVGLNVLRARFGKEAAKEAIKVTFWLLLFFVVMAALHLLYVPAKEDVAQSAYSQLLLPAPRLLLASLAAFYCVQRFDIFCLEKLQKLSFRVRTGVATLLSQLLDTGLFTVIGLFGLLESLPSLFLLSFLMKSLLIGGFTLLLPKYSNDPVSL